MNKSVSSIHTCSLRVTVIRGVMYCRLQFLRFCVVQAARAKWFIVVYYVGVIWLDTDKHNDLVADNDNRLFHQGLFPPQFVQLPVYVYE